MSDDMTPFKIDLNPQDAAELIKELCEENTRLRAELAAELETSIRARAAHGAALLKIMKLREALAKARDSIDVRFSDDEYNAVVDRIDAVLEETKGEEK